MSLEPTFLNCANMTTVIQIFSRPSTSVINLKAINRIRFFFKTQCYMNLKAIFRQRAQQWIVLPACRGGFHVLPRLEAFFAAEVARLDGKVSAVHVSVLFRKPLQTCSYCRFCQNNFRTLIIRSEISISPSMSLQYVWTIAERKKEKTCNLYVQLGHSYFWD